jgi:hypothetical protein
MHEFSKISGRLHGNKKQISSEESQRLGASVQDLVAVATWILVFVHPCLYDISLNDSCLSGPPLKKNRVIVYYSLVTSICFHIEM